MGLPVLPTPFRYDAGELDMTTNSIERMSAAFLDRRKIIRLKTPSFDQLAAAGAHLLRDCLPDHQQDLGGELLNDGLRRLEEKHVRVSLRQVERMVETVLEGLGSPRLF